MKRDPVLSAPLSHPWALWLLKTLLLLLGLFAMAPGINMMLDPSGKGIGFPEGSLDGSPFSSYFLPGLLLTIFNGLLPIFAWLTLWKKPHFPLLDRINPFPERHWAWTLALISGFGLVIWIVVQMLMVPYFFLQPLMLTWGIVLVLLCFNAGVRAFYKRSGIPIV